MKTVIIFTDLDGTLLDYSSYSFEKALPALELIKQKNIPLIICSSKTKKEIEHYRKKLGNDRLFISENGGGIFIPKIYFGFEIADYGFDFEETGDYFLIKLGMPYSELTKALGELREKSFRVRGFGDMTKEEVADLTGLNNDEAEMAKERDFDEPFIFEGSEEEIQKLTAAIKSMGFYFTQGRFFHIFGNSDKGKAVSIVIELYKKRFGEIVSIAIGDNPNDIPMLQKVDYPVIVQKPDGDYDPRVTVSNLIKADGIGPDGWNKAVVKCLREIF